MSSSQSSLSCLYRVEIKGWFNFWRMEYMNISHWVIDHLHVWCHVESITHKAITSTNVEIWLIVSSETFRDILLMDLWKYVYYYDNGD